MAGHGKIKTEAGSGGKVGHSNMTHWARSAFIKRAARKARRANDKRLAREER